MKTAAFVATLSATLSAALIVAACGGSSNSPTSPDTTATTVTPAPTPAASTVTGCVVTASTPGTPVGGTNGPYFHNIAVGNSTNGLTVTNANDALAHASVPDAVVLPDGSVGVYYVNGETDGIWLGRISGTSVTPVSAISIDGFTRPQGAVDPDAQLINGKIRLTYLFGFASKENHRICMAESTDGIKFTTLSLAMTFTAQQETDPSVIQLPSGSWLMAVSRGTSTILARSTTGTSFTEYTVVNYGGVPELALTSDNRVRLYVCATTGIDAWVSADSGSSWTREGTLTGTSTPGRGGSCDPSALPSRNLFVFKTQ